MFEMVVLATVNWGLGKFGTLMGPDHSLPDLIQVRVPWLSFQKVVVVSQVAAVCQHI